MSKEPDTTKTTRVAKKKPIRRIRRRANVNQIPDSITKNADLIKAISSTLPPDYEFEIFKTLWKIDQLECKHVALQMPEGLLMYATVIGDILKRFCVKGTLTSVSVLGDVTYGACCIDDLGARALGADLLVHYGHSCLVPMTSTVIPCLYVFVEIRIDVQHFCECVCATIAEGVALDIMGTVQFRSAVAEAAKLLSSDKYNRPCTIPQAKPLSPGEVLGCTAPTLPSEAKVMLFIADGRFHLEAAMIANPHVRALRYDPYSKVLTEEGYETDKMKDIRHDAIAKGRTAKTFGIVLGTLGRQGNPAIVTGIRKKLREHGKRSFVLLLSEIFPRKLDMLPQADAWVQVACPRLSIDWGHFFTKPVLSPYEMEVCLGNTEWKETYPMDFYSQGSGEWTNYHEKNKERVTAVCGVD